MSGYDIRRLPFLTDLNGRLVGVISANGQEVFFPTFTPDQLSLLKPDGSVLAGQGGGPTYTLPPATTTTLGGLKIGSGLAVSADGTVMVTAGGGGGTSYTLPPATTTTLGGIKVGANLTVGTDGTLNASAGAAGSARLVFTSSTCTSDTDLTFLSNTTGTDQVAKLQALLDLAVNGPLILVFDGAYTVGTSSSTTSLRIRSNTTVMALPGCGAKMANESLVPMWRNYNPTVITANIVDTNIEISGGIWHGNSANQSKRETSANGGISIMDFVGVKKLRMTGAMQLLRGRGFGWRGTNVFNVDIEDGTIQFDDGQTIVSTDGYHFNGPAQYISVRNVRLLNCADDALAFNADDAWVAAQNAGTAGPYVSWGDITDVLVDGVFLQGYVCGIRMLSGASRMDRFVFRNIQGKTGGYWLIINNHIPADVSATGAGNVGCVEIDGVCMENIPVNGWFPSQAHVNCKVEQISFRNITKGKFNNVQYPVLTVGVNADVGQVSIDGYKGRSYNGGSYLTEQIYVAQGAKIGTLRVDNSDFYAGVAVSGSPITIAAGATVEQLIGVGNSGKNFSTFVNNLGTVINNHFPENTLNFMDAGAASTWTLDSGFAEVSATAVNFATPKTAILVARKTAVDAFQANIQLACTVRFAGTPGGALNAGLLVRGVNLQPYQSGSRAAYVLDISQTSGRVSLQRSDAGGDTIIGAAVTVGGGISLNADYKGTITAKSTTLSASFQRVSDGFYLQPNGTFSATVSNFSTGTDTGLGAGSGLQYGVYAYNANASASIAYTNFGPIAAP